MPNILQHLHRHLSCGALYRFILRPAIFVPSNVVLSDLDSRMAPLYKISTDAGIPSRPHMAPTPALLPHGIGPKGETGRLEDLFSCLPLPNGEGAGGGSSRNFFSRDACRFGNFFLLPRTTAINRARQKKIPC